MKIIQFKPFDEIKEEIKNVPMLTDESVKPYRNSRIQLLEFDPNDLNITSLYYIKWNLAFQKELKLELEKLWYDLFKIWWILNYEWNDWKEYSIMPPVVEVVEREMKILANEWEINYDKIFKIKFPVLLDWLHRALLAKTLWTTIQVLYIDNVDKNCPSYAHPNTWEELIWYDEVPTDKNLKKYYLREDAKSLYKNFWVLVHSFFRTK